jgi:hypothetical protein
VASHADLEPAEEVDPHTRVVSHSPRAAFTTAALPAQTLPAPVGLGQ